ncbi:MAG: acyl-CoA dehydrogenase family protein [Acidimicrobiales bacterium]|nr:acyl-CoA dehydrogenase family protein [Acidimicrobiales bacterium]
MDTETSTHEPADHAAIRAEAAAWLAQHWNPALDSRTWLATVVDAGWSAPSWPVEWFGKGITPDAARAVDDEFKKVGAGGYGQDVTNLWANTVLAFGQDELKREVMRPLLLGELDMCLLYSEPGAGSDLASVQTRAERDGDEWIVNGQKVWTSGGRQAAYALLIARTDLDQPKHRGITFFFFPMKQAGVEVRPIRQATGDSRFNEVFITDARVPDANRLGELNAGWWVLQTALMYERAVMGVTQRRDRDKEKAKINRDPTSEWSAPVPDLELVEFARARGRTGDPIVRQDLARLHCMRMVNEWNGRRAKALMEQGSSTPLASLGKLAMSGILHFAGRLQVNLLGPEGALWGPDWPDSADASYALHNAFFTSIGGGTDQIQRNIIGERILGLPKEPEVDKHVPFREVKKSPGRTLTR